ncbi:hypothetical protein MASR2M36_19540 [Providencia sp.]
MFKYRVDSPNISSIGYDGEAKVLEINYSSERICRYRNVPLVTYQRLSVAKNKERYIERYINDSYMKITDC